MQLEYASGGESFHFRNWFGVGVRLIGIWQIVEGLNDIVIYIEMVIKYYRSATVIDDHAYLIFAGFHLLTGLMLILFVKQIINSCYPPLKVIKDDSPTTAN